MRNWINKKAAELNMWAVEKSAAREEGQGTVEYAVVLGVLVVIIVGAFKAADVGTTITSLVDRVDTLIPVS